MAVTEHSALKYWANLLQYTGQLKTKLKKKPNITSKFDNLSPKSYHSSNHLKRAYVQSAPAAIDVIFGTVADLRVEHCQTLHLVTSAFLYLIVLEKQKNYVSPSLLGNTSLTALLIRHPLTKPLNQPKPQHIKATKSPWLPHLTHISACHQKNP